jgi:hypothetical protein
MKPRTDTAEALADEYFAKACKSKRAKKLWSLEHCRTTELLVAGHRLAEAAAMLPVLTRDATIMVMSEVRGLARLYMDAEDALVATRLAGKLFGAKKRGSP